VKTSKVVNEKEVRTLGRELKRSATCSQSEDPQLQGGARQFSPKISNPQLNPQFDSPENSVHPTAKSYRQANRRLNQLATCLSW
jgi:hypothetical protein